jgi:hypothetical protein
MIRQAHAVLIMIDYQLQGKSNKRDLNNANNEIWN